MRKVRGTRKNENALIVERVLTNVSLETILNLLLFKKSEYVSQIVKKVIWKFKINDAESILCSFIFTQN